MLIKKDCTGKSKSIFKCDRCNKVIDTDIEARYRIIVQKKASKTIHSWDLCKRCYAALYRALERKEQ